MIEQHAGDSLAGHKQRRSLGIERSWKSPGSRVDAMSGVAGASSSDGLAVRPPAPIKIYPMPLTRGLIRSDKVWTSRKKGASIAGG